MQHVFHPRLELALVTLIRPDVPQAREGVTDSAQEGCAAAAVGLIGGQHLHAQQQAGTIDQGVALAALLLVAVVAPDPPFSLVRTDWLSRMAAVGFAPRSAFRRVRSRNAVWMRSQVPSRRHWRK